MQNALCLEAINSSLTINHTTMNMMRRLWLMWLFVAAMIANSCTNLTEVEDRLDALEEEVSQIQNAIEALNDAYDDGKVITSVEPSQKEEGGWIVTFSDGTSIELVNGKDGKDGENGNNGADGKDGADGADGKDGVTPYLRVDQEGYWCISYDGGETFSRLMDNEGNYIRATGEQGPQGEKGEQGEQGPQGEQGEQGPQGEPGEKGEEGISVRVATDEDGYYMFLMYYASSPENIIDSIKTPYHSNPSGVIRSISQDDQTNVITITLEDGTSYTFNKEYAMPTSIALLSTEGIKLGRRTLETIEFRVNPSNAKFNYSVGLYGCEIALDKVGKTRATSYVTKPTNYKLSKVEQVYDEQGVAKTGQYRAYIRDAGISDNYIEDAALVLTVNNANNEKVQISSSAFKVAFAGNILSSFSFLKENNEGVITDVEAVIDGNNITICSPLVTDRSKLVATFSTNGAKVLVNGAEQISGYTAVDFSSPVQYMVFSSSGEMNIYNVSVSGTGLPTVIINTPNGAQIPPKTADWLEGTYIKIINADGTTDYEGKEDNIRGRGNSTWGYPKKPYALKLDSKASILGMPKHKRWVLLANWMDRTMLRNHVAFTMAKKTCLAWTPRGEFVEVVLNGKHVGNYYLCEQIKVDENRVNIHEMEDTDTEGDAITGGYLMELDTYFDEVNKFKSSIKGLPYMFKEPDEDVLNKQQFAYMQNYVNRLEEVLYDDTYFAIREYAKYIDIDTYIDWWLVHEITFNGEPNHPKSSYMHKDKGGKLKAGPVWDFDWGTFVPTNTAFRLAKAIYYERLFEDPAFVARVKERWAELKPAFEEIPPFIEAEKVRLDKSASINIELWPISSRTNGDETLSYDAAVTRMINAYRSRLQTIDRIITSL